MARMAYDRDYISQVINSISESLMHVTTMSSDLDAKLAAADEASEGWPFVTEVHAITTKSNQAMVQLSEAQTQLVYDMRTMFEELDELASSDTLSGFDR